MVPQDAQVSLTCFESKNSFRERSSSECPKATILHLFVFDSLLTETFQLTMSFLSNKYSTVLSVDLNVVQIASLCHESITNQEVDVHIHRFEQQTPELVKHPS